MNKIKVNDQVVVIAGKNKGKTGKVLKIDKKNLKLVVEGLNIVKRAIKPSQANPEAGFVEKEAMIHSSNVQLLSPKTKKATRVGFKIEAGKKVRTAKACGSKV